MRRISLRDPKRLIPLLIGSVAGVLVLINRFFPDQTQLVSATTILLDWVAIIAAFAVLVGVLSVVLHHVRRLAQRDQRSIYSIAVLIGVVIPPAIALYAYFGESTADVTRSQTFQDLVAWVYTPLSISLLALLTFFAISAAIRALGDGNRQAMVIIVVAALMLLVQLPLLSFIPYLDVAVQWIQDYIALAGLRGLIFGASIGAIVASVRILLGIDLPYLDR